MSSLKTSLIANGDTEGSALVNLNASALASGTVPAGRFPATLPAADGSALTNVAATTATTAAACSGNAATATQLATSRTLNGAGFDGTANVSVPLPSTTVTASCPSATATTVLTLANSGNQAYLCVATFGALGDPTNYTVVCTIVTDGGSAVVTNIKTAGSATVTVSGLNVQLTQSSGATKTGTLRYTPI